MSTWNRASGEAGRGARAGGERAERTDTDGKFVRLARKRESHEVSLACLRTRNVVEPVVEAHDVEGRGAKDVLQLDLGLTAVTAVAKTEDSGALRDGAFNPGALV